MTEPTETNPHPFLALEDEDLLAQCDVHLYRASGPGGQHRNKVTSAVRLHHRPTGVRATAADSRSQHENRRRALKRLRMELALRLRGPATAPGDPLPTVLAGCVHAPKGGGPKAKGRFVVGRKDDRYWPVVAVVLDLLEHSEGRLGDVSARIGTSTGNVLRVLRADRHAWAACQDLRRRHGQRPLT